MKVSVFYSWQSDSSYKTNKYYIEDAIKKCVKTLNKDSTIIACIDRDTKDELGSPEIHKSVFNKINHSKFFICDISLDANNKPNSNVLIELGYAIKVLGWNRIICMFNSNSGKIEDLPFDINHNRVTPYNPDKPNEKRRIADIIHTNISSLFKKGELYNPIEDHLKKKIDYIVLNILRNIVNLFNFEQEVVFSKRLLELEKLSVKDMAYRLTHTQTLGFYYLYDYEHSQNELESILNQLLSCNYFSDSWRANVIHFIDWIDLWDKTIDPHLSPDLFKEIVDSNYAIKDMHIENQTNPPNSVLLLKHYKDDQYTVIQGGSLTMANRELGNKLVYLQDVYGYIFAVRIKHFITHLNNWLDESGNEIILDPHYYLFRENNASVFHEDNN